MSDGWREQIVERTRAEQQRWRRLVDDVGRDRMNEPGPMGPWTFKDVASHLTGWRNCRIAQLEAAGRGAPEPRCPWPAELDDDDSINDWIRDHDQGRAVDDLLADYNGSFDRLAAAIVALPDEIATDPNAFPWMQGVSVIEADWFDHLRDEHEPAIREWLSRSGAASR